jgi:hypothetical protein
MIYKTFLFSALLALTLVSCNEKGKTPAVDTSLIQNSATADGNNSEKTDGPQLNFREVEKDFGMILHGERVMHRFNFTNSGNKTLVVTGVSSSCGCTVADYSKEPIEPGKSGYVEVTFDSQNRQGFQEKSITVLSNCEPNRKELKIKANVIMPN